MQKRYFWLGKEIGVSSKMTDERKMKKISGWSIPFLLIMQIKEKI